MVNNVLSSFAYSLCGLVQSTYYAVYDFDLFVSEFRRNHFQYVSKYVLPIRTCKLSYIE